MANETHVTVQYKSGVGLIAFNSIESIERKSKSNSGFIKIKGNPNPFEIAFNINGVIKKWEKYLAVQSTISELRK